MSASAKPRLAGRQPSVPRREPLIAEEERLLRRLRGGLAALPGVCELSLWGREHPRVGIVALTVDGRDAREVAETLSRDHGIGSGTAGSARTSW